MALTLAQATACGIVYRRVFWLGVFLPGVAVMVPLAVWTVWTLLRYVTHVWYTLLLFSLSLLVGYVQIRNLTNGDALKLQKTLRRNTVKIPYVFVVSALIARWMQHHILSDAWPETQVNSIPFVVVLRHSLRLAAATGLLSWAVVARFLGSHSVGMSRLVALACFLCLVLLSVPPFIGSSHPRFPCISSPVRCSTVPLAANPMARLRKSLLEHPIETFLQPSDIPGDTALKFRQNVVEHPSNAAAMARVSMATPTTAATSSSSAHPHTPLAGTGTTSGAATHQPRRWQHPTLLATLSQAVISLIVGIALTWLSSTNASGDSRGTDALSKGNGATSMAAICRVTVPITFSVVINLLQTTLDGHGHEMDPLDVLRCQEGTLERMRRSLYRAIQTSLPITFVGLVIQMILTRSLDTLSWLVTAIQCFLVSFYLFHFDAVLRYRLFLPYFDIAETINALRWDGSSDRYLLVQVEGLVRSRVVTEALLQLPLVGTPEWDHLNSISTVLADRYFYPSREEGFREAALEEDVLQIAILLTMFQPPRTLSFAAKHQIKDGHVQSVHDTVVTRTMIVIIRALAKVCQRCCGTIAVSDSLGAPLSSTTTTTTWMPSHWSLPPGFLFLLQRSIHFLSICPVQPTWTSFVIDSLYQLHVAVCVGATHSLLSSALCKEFSSQCRQAASRWMAVTTSSSISLTPLLDTQVQSWVGVGNNDPTNNNDTFNSMLLDEEGRRPVDIHTARRKQW